MLETPFDQIKESLSKNVPSELIKHLPDKWEKVGEVLLALTRECRNLQGNADE